MGDKDRHSRMIDSSVNAPAKKDGAGGSYTWGSAVDDPVDFIPISSEVVGPNVITSTMPIATTTVVEAQPFRGNLLDNRQFPGLGTSGYAAPVASGVVQVPTMAPGARAWPASAAPKVVLTAETLRPGTTDLFDSTHPRNMFASRPVTTSTVVQSTGPQMAIDWSTSGIPMEVNRSLIASGSPSHLGLYQQAQATRVPAQYLRPATAPIQAARSYRVQGQGKPAVVKQMRAQGSRGQY